MWIFSLYPFYNYFWLDLTLNTTVWLWVYDDGTPMSRHPGYSAGYRDLYMAQMTYGFYSYIWYGDATRSITVATQLCQREQNTNN